MLQSRISSISTGWIRSSGRPRTDRPLQLERGCRETPGLARQALEAALLRRGKRDGAHVGDDSGIGPVQKAWHDAGRER
jgi:hypothetical protein